MWQEERKRREEEERKKREDEERIRRELEEAKRIREEAERKMREEEQRRALENEQRRCGGPFVHRPEEPAANRLNLRPASSFGDCLSGVGGTLHDR